MRKSNREKNSSIRMSRMLIFSVLQVLELILISILFILSLGVEMLHQTLRSMKIFLIGQINPNLSTE